MSAKGFEPLSSLRLFRPRQGFRPQFFGDQARTNQHVNKLTKTRRTVKQRLDKNLALQKRTLKAC